MTKAIIALIILCGIIWFVCRPIRHAWRAPEITEGERAFYKARHRVHGIAGSIRDQNGDYFLREGERCRL